MSESQEKKDIELKEMKISELTPFVRRLQVRFVVIEKGESRTITSKKTNEEHTLADIKIGDETGTIILTLWDGTIDQVSEGSTYIVKNGYINVFQQHMRLALGKWGTLEKSEDTIELDAVNMDNDRSEEIHEDQRRRRIRPRRSPDFSSHDRNQSDSESRY
jgi:replication factor A1